MPSTSISLLRRLQRSTPGDASGASLNNDDWGRFVELYAPLIFYWGRNEGLSATDSADLVQDVLTVLVKELRQFKYEPSKGRFRGWLRTITVNRARDLKRRRSIEPSLSDPATIESIQGHAKIDLFEEREYQQFVTGRALELIKTNFSSDTWQAFWRQVVDGEPAGQVAQEMNLSLNVIYLAKSRVLAGLREELGDLLN